MGMFETLTPEQRGHLVGKMEQAAADVRSELYSALRLGLDTYDNLYGPRAAHQYVGMTGDIVGILADLATQPHVIIT